MKRIFLSASLALLFLSLWVYPSLANDWQTWDAATNVPQNKTWTIKFNQSVDPASISQSVYVMDSNNQIFSMTAYPSVDGKSVSVLASSFYEPGETYCLYISDSLKSSSGEPLKSKTKKYFTIALSADQAAPTSLTAIAPTTVAGTDGKITGTTTAMQLKLATADDSAYETCSAGSTTVATAGDYAVRYAAKLGYNASPAVAVTVPAYGAPPSAINVTITTNPGIMKVGDTLSIEASVKLSDGKYDYINYLVTSSDPNIISVNGKAITTISSGTATITVSKDDKTASITVTVMGGNPSINNAADLETYLNTNYSEFDTIVGHRKINMQVIDYLGNSKYTILSDYQWDANKYGIYGNNNTYLSELKEHQQTIANAAIAAMPNKLITGQYFVSGYIYPHIREGFWAHTMHSWEYSPSEGFLWTPEDDLE